MPTADSGKSTLGRQPRDPPLPRSRADPVQDERERHHEPDRPVEKRGDGPQPLVPEVVQKVAAHDEPDDEADEEASGSAAPLRRPPSNDVSAGKPAERPRAADREGSVQREAPWLERMPRHTEFVVMPDTRVEEQPHHARGPEPDTNRVEDQALRR